MSYERPPDGDGTAEVGPLPDGWGPRDFPMPEPYRPRKRRGLALGVLTACVLLTSYLLLELVFRRPDPRAERAIAAIRVCQVHIRQTFPRAVFLRRTTNVTIRDSPPGRGAVVEGDIEVTADARRQRFKCTAAHHGRDDWRVVTTTFEPSG